MGMKKKSLADDIIEIKRTRRQYGNKKPDNMKMADTRNEKKLAKYYEMILTWD